MWQRVLNVVWPTVICLLLLTSCATQIITCFRRDMVGVVSVINIRQYGAAVTTLLHTSLL